MVKSFDKNVRKQELFNILLTFLREHNEVLISFPKEGSQIVVNFSIDNRLSRGNPKFINLTNGQVEDSIVGPEIAEGIRLLSRCDSAAIDSPDRLQPAITLPIPEPSEGDNSSESSESKLQRNKEYLQNRSKNSVVSIVDLSTISAYLAIHFKDHDAMSKLFDCLDIPSDQLGLIQEESRMPHKIHSLVLHFKKINQLRNLYQVAKEVLEKRGSDDAGIEATKALLDNRLGSNTYKVFISYSWDPETHKNKVLTLANTLYREGVDIDIDRYASHTPKKGWDIWVDQAIENAKFVLVVCNEAYKKRFYGEDAPGKGLGVVWETRIIRSLIYKSLEDTKFIPIVLSSGDEAYIPSILTSRSRYILDNNESVEDLIYHLREVPRVQKPKRRERRVLMPLEPEFYKPS